MAGKTRYPLLATRRILLFFRLPIPHLALSAVKIDTDQSKWLLFQAIFLGIGVGFDLLQGFCRAAVQLELKEKNMIGQLNHRINATLPRFDFGADLHADHEKD